MSTGAELLLVGLVGMVAPEVAQPEWGEQLERGTPRLSMGFAAGIHLGGVLRGEWSAVSWRHGELGIGGLFATHVHFQRDPRAPQPGVTIRGLDTSVNLAPSVVHTFRFARRRVGLGAGVYAGISIRNQHTRIEDEVNDWSRRHDFTAPFADLGTLVHLDVRLGARWGVALDGVVPLYLGPDAVAIPTAWAVTGPYVGLSAMVHL